MLSSRPKLNYANCVAQAEDGILVTGSVPLIEALKERRVDVGDTAAVVAYLKENLSWRVVKVSVYRHRTNRTRIDSWAN
jgi:hypothetical protein